jgi:hypothetical protein
MDHISTYFMCMDLWQLMRRARIKGDNTIECGSDLNPLIIDQ